MSVGNIILLLEFCLKSTYLSFQGQFYEQVKGAAMGSLVSPIVAKLYMEYFEQKSSKCCPYPSGYGAGMCPTTGLWCLYVDDTCHPKGRK